MVREGGRATLIEGDSNILFKTSRSLEREKKRGKHNQGSSKKRCNPEVYQVKTAKMKEKKEKNRLEGSKSEERSCGSRRHLP